MVPRGGVDLLDSQRHLVDQTLQRLVAGKVAGAGKDHVPVRLGTDFDVGALDVRNDPEK